jgi:hypothetical protein
MTIDKILILYILMKIENSSESEKGILKKDFFFELLEFI